MADHKKLTKLINENNDAIIAKVNTNRGMALINHYDLVRITTGKLPLSKATTFLLAAWMYECGYIRFVNSHKKTEKSVDIGVNNNTFGVVNTHEQRISSNVRWHGRLVTGVNYDLTNHSDGLVAMLHSMKALSKNTPNPQINMVCATRSFGNTFDESSGVILDDDLNKTLIYHVANLLNKINAGDFAMSAVFEAIEKHLKERKMLSIADVTKYIHNLENVLSAEKIDKILTAKDAVMNVEIPDINPNTPPHAYQWKGVAWLLEAERGVLAFGTGLGKTYISILFTYVAKRQGLIKGSIVFTKEKIITDFAREINNKWPDAVVTILHGTPDERLGKMQAAANSDFVICSYGPLIRRMPEMVEFFNENKDMAMFFDEGSRIRNSNTQMNDVVKEVIDGRRYVIILDATPFDNDVLVEAFNLIDLLRHNQLGTMRAWRKQYSSKKEATLTTGRSGYVYENLDKMQQAIAPFINMKREDDPDVDAELPPERHEFDKIITLGPEQTKWYARAVEMTLEELVNMMDPRNANFQNPRNVLASIVRQRQCAISPRLVDPSYDGDELRLESVVDQAEEWLKSDDKSPIIIGAEFRSIFPALRTQLHARMPWLSQTEIQELSGKTTGLKAIDEIKDGLNNGSIKIGLLGIVSAGSGINLQSSCHRVLVLHKTWNPKKISQFIDRVDRQGQKKRVTVIHYIADDTIDAHIEDTLARKAFENEQMLTGTSMEKSTKMSIKELAGIAGISMDEVKRRAGNRGVQSSTVDEIAEATVNAREID